jgi:hypothetical protein
MFGALVAQPVRFPDEIEVKLFPLRSSDTAGSGKRPGLSGSEEPGNGSRELIQSHLKPKRLSRQVNPSVSLTGSLSRISPMILRFLKNASMRFWRVDSVRLNDATPNGFYLAAVCGVFRIFLMICSSYTLRCSSTRYSFRLSTAY